ncbi:TATA element modulatory factor-like isoform X2 [Anneissia japonica]|uniref:TATA element modulatory factor-like isoform X2 n=1 Tax=Anneissia japonica TaxID=1529436 RepID=UPI00142553F7|nr:TATA element modulatory factor-like isoform X2 [Anneissia japonica]
MSWFDSSFSNFAKAALSNAQKSIDRALDIHDGGNADDDDQNQTQSEASVKKSKVGVGATNKKSTGSRASPVTDTKTPQRSTSSTSVRSAKSSESSDSFFDEFFESGSSSPEVKPVKSRSPLRRSTSGPKTKQTKSLLKLKSEESRKQNVEEIVSKKGQNNKESFSEVDLNEKIDEEKVTHKLEEQKNEGDNILKTDGDDALKVSEGKDHPDAKQRQKEKDPDIPVEKKCSDSDDHSQSSSDNVDASKPKIQHRKTVKDKANDDVKKLHRRSSESPSDGKSDQSDAGDDHMSLKSDSDFVVISDWNGSEISSVYDLRESSAVSSPKNMSCSSNGKRSPDSDFSVISDGKLSEMQEGIPMNAVLHKAPITLSERFSPSYSADTESEKSSPSHSDHGGRRTPTPLGSDENGEDNRSSEESPPKMTMKLEEGLLKVAEKVAQHADTPGPLHDTDTSEPKESVENSQGGLDPNLHSPLTQDPLQSDKLLKKLAEQAEILQARERQIMTLSSQAIDNQETNNILRSQLKQVEELRETEQKDITNLTEEFTNRLASMETKLQGSQKERDSLKKQLTSTQKLLKEREGDTKMAEDLKEKDEQITELMAEGEKLSKQQLQNSKIIKKLRSKEKETEGVLKSLNEQLKESQERVTHLEEVLDAKEEVEKKNKEGIKVLNSAVERQEKEVKSLRLEVEESREKIRSTQAALDTSYKEIAELNKKIAAKDSMVQESQLSAEMNAKESLRLALERAQQESRMDQETLALQVNDLRMSLSRSDQKYARKEDRLKQEIGDLQQRLQEGEDRNQELSQNVSAATKPLLRQIENLQATFNAQSSTWEQVEKSLTERLVECQSQLATATEKERLAAEGSLEVNSKLASLESQVALLRQEKTKYLTALEMEKSKLQTLEDTVDRDALQMDSQRATYTKALEELQKDKALLERKLEVEKMKVEAEHKKLLLAQDTIKEKTSRFKFYNYEAPSFQSEKRAQDYDSNSSHSHTSRSSTPTKDERHHHHHSPLIFSPSQGEILERTISITGGISNVYDSVAAGSATSVMENLQSQLKQREGEITLYQGEITQLERTRGSMAEEIVNLANQKEQLEEEVKVLPDLNRKLNDLEHRYNAVLQMYGEKAEEVEELRLDLQDVKSMYRQQIEDLIRSK